MPMNMDEVYYVLNFISGVFQELSMKNKEVVNLNISEVWSLLHWKLK